MGTVTAGQNLSETIPGFWAQVASGEWEPYTFDILKEYVPLHETFLDLGAWIGPTVLYAAGLGRRCIAVEPDPIAFAHLKANVEATAAPVELLNAAVMEYDGTVTLGSESLGNSMTRVSKDSNTVEVPCLTLSTLMEEKRIAGSLFIKMDVEGAEENILRDYAFFEKHRPTLYLSLHTFWFCSLPVAVENLDRVCSLYKTREEVSNNVLLLTNL
jgi:FkbM family methyltransferase